MNVLRPNRRWLRAFVAGLALVLGPIVQPARGAGVTVITHGFNGNVEDWVIPMTEVVSGHPSFRGTSVSCYEISITRNGSGQYVAAATFLGGVAPTLTDSGEILVKLDWSSLAGFLGPSSTTIASAAVGALMSTTLIPAMGGRPLVELPLHLVGHSRGGSVVTEMARLLGAQGVWVDHVTTLDPVPVSFPFNDADVFTYANVLFADNYWQTLSSPSGKALSGAYNRRLLSLPGGYSSSHSDVHLWYHGTIELTTADITVDGATIGAAERGTWWTATEAAGSAAGFRYGLIGRGDRLSSVEPAGAGNGRISDGFNKRWDLGGGVANNRTALPVNSGLWPNAIRFVLTNADPVSAGGTFAATLYHQSGSVASGNVDVRIFLDTDFNPYDGIGIEVDQRLLANTGTGNVILSSLNVNVNPTTVAPGNYAVCARIHDGVRTRYLYASEMLEVTASSQQPTVDAASLTYSNGVVRFNVLAFPGQNVTIKATTDFVDWLPVGTHQFTGTIWQFVDADAGSFPQRFYKAVLAP
jgi:hypothetical protein